MTAKKLFIHSDPVFVVIIKPFTRNAWQSLAYSQPSLAVNSNISGTAETKNLILVYNMAICMLH